MKDRIGALILILGAASVSVLLTGAFVTGKGPSFLPWAIVSVALLAAMVIVPIIAAAREELRDKPNTGDDGWRDARLWLKDGKRVLEYPKGTFTEID